MRCSLVYEWVGFFCSPFFFQCVFAFYCLPAMDICNEKRCLRATDPMVAGGIPFCFRCLLLSLAAMVAGGATYFGCCYISSATAGRAGGGLVYAGVAFAGFWFCLAACINAASALERSFFLREERRVKSRANRNGTRYYGTEVDPLFRSGLI